MTEGQDNTIKHGDETIDVQPISLGMGIVSAIKADGYLVKTRYTFKLA